MGLWSISKLQINNIKVYDDPYCVAPVFIYLSKKSTHKDLWKALFRELNQVIDSGEYQKITDNYISKKKFNQ